MKKRLYVLNVWLLCAGVMAFWGAVSEAPAELTFRPHVVHIGTWYDGAKLHVEAPIASGCEAVLELSGEKEQTRLMRKERHWGIWKNGAEILEEGAPTLYLAMSTDPQLLRRSKDAVSWGYDAIAGRVLFKGAGRETTQGQLFDEFLRLKESRGRYGIFPGRAGIKGLPGGGQLVEGIFNLPTHLAQGNYQLVLSVVKDGRVVKRETRPVKVELAGFPATIFHLAHQHAVTYGILAAGIAILSGFLVGLIFQFIGKPKRPAQA